MDLTTETEYVAASNAAKKDFWFKKFITELGVITSDAIPLYCDNNGAIVLAKESRSHRKSKHIERRYHSYATISKKNMLGVKSRLHKQYGRLIDKAIEPAKDGSPP